MNVRLSLDRFLNTNKINTNRFFAKLKGDDIKTYFGEIYSVESKKVILNDKGKRLQIFFPKDNNKFIVNSSYEFSLIVNFDEEKNKETFFVDYKNNPPSEIENLVKPIKAIVINTEKPITLERKNISQKPNPIVEAFLQRNGIKTNRFFGKCVLTEKGNYIFTEVISKLEGNFLLDNLGNRQTVFISKESNICFDDNFYEFSIHILTDKETKDEFLVVDFKLNPPCKLDYNPYKEIVRLRYERLDNPEANKMIANLMREIGKGLYSSKQRMIFELLQNADDTPAGDEVHFYIDVFEDYFLIMHNGIPFNRDDVEAITSAAESTKRNDRKKTGYKGIGFKSVFTDSEEVIIKSGGFLFSFIRNYSGFESFDTFYFNKQRYKDYPKLLEEDRLKYTRQRQVFHGNTDIPWQLIPIWQDDVPDILKETRYVQFGNNNNVGIAIKFGREKIKEYLDAVEAFAQKPHFMLFLRNVSLFKSFKNKLDISKTGNNPITINKTAWTTYNQEIKVEIRYFKKEIDDIEVNDQSLSDEGIQIYKKERINEYGEKSHYFSTDIEGLKEIETIPPKLAAFDKTTISFAAPIIDNKLQAEPEYLKGSLISSFFTYLPTKEQRICLPFLVNADFVPDSSREKLQGDNQWNEYIIAKIARNHVMWLKELAEQCSDTHRLHGEYLSLLLNRLLPGDDTINLLINKYNTIYLRTIRETAFILSKEYKILRTNEVIIDSAGISKVLGDLFLYEITQTTKLLPNSKITSKYLLFDYLDVEQYTDEDFILSLKKDSNADILRERLSKLEESEYYDFLKWFNNIAKRNDFDKEWLLKIPFIRADSIVYSVKELNEINEILLNNSKISNVGNILKKLDFKITDFEFDIYSSLWDKLDIFNIKDKELYERIASNENLALLNPTEKSQLFSFIVKLDNVGNTKYAESLCLFTSEAKEGNLKPIGQLISNSCINSPLWLNSLKISTDEEDELDDTYKKLLLVEKNFLGKIFCNLSLFNEVILNLNIENIMDFYDYILSLVNQNKLAQPTLPSGLSEMPWLYIENIKSFRKSDQAYFPDSILKLSQEKFNHAKQVIQQITDLNIPHYAAIEIIRIFSLGSRRISLTDSIDNEGSFGLEIINDFLDWLIENKEDEFLSEKLVLQEDGEYKILPAKGKILYYTPSVNLVEFINGQENLKEDFCLLDRNIYSDSLKKIGLIEGDLLIDKLIDAGSGTLQLATYVTSAFRKDTICKYLLNLDQVEIDTTKSYESTTDLNKVINLALDNILDDEEKSNKFRAKLKVDSYPLLERAISGDIYFPSTKTELNIKLSDVLPDYKDKTYSLTSVLDSFVNIDKQKLRKLFEPQKISPKRIHTELYERIKDEFNPVQTFFVSFYQKQLGVVNVFQGRKTFTNRFDINREEYGKLAQEFLTICLNEGSYIGYIDHIIFPDFKPKETITTNDFALACEVAPSWVQRWIGSKDNEARLEYLKLLGINDSNSNVVQLRKAILDGNADMDVARGSLSSKLLFKNTLEWIRDNHQKCKSNLNGELLKPLYTKAFQLGLTIKEIYFPVITDIIEFKFKLEKYVEGAEYHRYNDKWKGYETEIFNYSLRSNIKVVSNVLPDRFLTDINAKMISVQEGLNQNLIASKTVEFKKKFYLSWPKKDQFPIKVYKGSKIPYQIIYNLFSIKEIERDSIVKNGNYLLVCEDIVDSIPRSIKEFMPTILYNDLNSHIKEFEENLSKIDYTDEELAALKKIYNDDIPEEFRKNLNLAALVSALVQLPNAGFNVDAAELNLENTHEFAQLSPVYKESNRDNPYTLMCRSARQGLLYMTAKAWNRLDDESILLFADLGHSSYKLFYNKQDILNANDKDTDYQILRIETEANVSNVEKILNGTFDQKDKIWIIFRIKENKNYDVLYYKKLEPDNSNRNNSAIRTDFSDILNY